MDPVFTLQWPEFVVAERLQQMLPKNEGYSVLIPLSRQEKGIDLAIMGYDSSGRSSVLTVQVKASRTYLPQPPKRRNTVRYLYYTWFNRFDVPKKADWFVLVGMYAPELERTRPGAKHWYRDCSLAFTQMEMRHFISECKTVRGKPDKMFGFGFNDLSSIILTRGDMNRSGRDYKEFLLENRINEFKKQLKGEPGGAPDAAAPRR